MSKYTDLFNIYCDFVAKYDPYYIIDGRPNPADMLYNMYEIRKDFISDPGADLLNDINIAIDHFESIMQKFSNIWFKFFVNHEILTQIDNGIQWAYIMPVNELIKLLRDHRRAQIDQGTATKNDVWTANVNDGFLYINDIPVGRIAPRLPKMPFNEYSNYIEGRILARNEID